MPERPELTAATTVALPQGYGAELTPGERSLAPYAASAAPSRGRLHPEPPCPTRNLVQRDRDRILHSTAFRRLIYKTQMFLFHEGDHFRTRLTHSLEVAQIARTIARQLRLDEDLAEALALAHDLGHPPFGHAGERALDELMDDDGGFDHNVQSFRIVTLLERKYAAFDGLNLCWETLEGLIKHNGPPLKSDGRADTRLLHAVRKFDSCMSLDLGRYASAEAQVAAIADDIAWMTHDIDDGLRAGLIGVADLKIVPLLAETIARIERLGLDHAVRDAHDGNEGGRGIYEVVRQLITDLVVDVVAQSRKELATLSPTNPDDIRNAGRGVVAFSGHMSTQIGELRSFLFARLYRNDRVMRVMDDAQSVIRDLVDRYRTDPTAMPAAWSEAADRLDQRRRARLIGDFVAGMTDRYAISEHRRLFAATPALR